MIKSIYISIIIFCFFFLFTSCKNEVKQVNEKEPATTNTQNLQSKSLKNKVTKVNYYQNLQHAINLTNIQVNKLKAIGKKYNKKLKAIPKNKTQLIKKTKAQKQQEIKKLLGEKLYLKKVAFDSNL